MTKAASKDVSDQRTQHSAQGGKPRTLQATVSLILDRRKNGLWPVSIADTVLAIRETMPNCDLNDDELSDMITIAAVERGLSITFDSDLLETEKTREPVFA